MRPLCVVAPAARKQSPAPDEQDLAELVRAALRRCGAFAIGPLARNGPSSARGGGEKVFIANLVCSPPPWLSIIAVCPIGTGEQESKFSSARRQLGAI